MKPTVYIPERIAVCGLEILGDECAVVAPWVDGREHGPDEQRAHLYEADATIVRLITISAVDIERCGKLKVIGRHGVGVDSIDCAAATKRRIAVVYTPAANANAVAEHTLALLMALAKKIGPAWRSVLEGRFTDRIHFRSVELAGKTLGVLGLGRIGDRVAQMAAHGLAMKVCAYDPVVDPSRYDGPATIEGSLETVLKQSDFLTLHVPVNPQTKGMINDDTLNLCKRGCRLINTSRGAVVDEGSLIRALESGQIGGAALDVFQTEPLPGDHPLALAPNTLLTPHISSSTPESLDNMARDAARGVLDVLQGRRPKYVVNPEVLA